MGWRIARERVSARRPQRVVDVVKGRDARFRIAIEQAGLLAGHLPADLSHARREFVRFFKFSDLVQPLLRQ